MNNSPWLWWKSSLPKIGIRMLITTVGLLFCIAPKAFATSMESMISDEQLFPQALVYSLFDTIIPCFAASFLTFGCLRFAFHKMKLDNEMASQGEFQTRE